VRSPATVLGLLFLGVILLVLPAGAGAYTVRLGTLIFMWAALAGSWNLLAGYAGVADLGPVVYYGIGAFATGILMTKVGWPFPLSLGLSGVIAVGIAFLVGTPTLRLRGAYFAIGTLALAESVKQLALAWDRVTGIALTGGSAGISLPLSAGHLSFYYLMLALMALVTAMAAWLGRSKFGYGLRAIGENESLAEASGVDLQRLKLRLYMLSALVIAWTGGVQAYWLSYVNANEAFGAGITFQMVVMALVGGLGTPAGPLLGAVFLTVVSEVLGAQLLHHYLIVIGVVIVSVCLFLPAGLVGLPARLWSKGAPSP
jgi:branched-chain amino acid transport system permease protein